MELTIQSYRLEVAVKRVYGLTPLVASTSSKIAVEVRFLDFPGIVIQPQGFVVGDSVTYNVCHKADFRMTAEQAASVFPAVCQCHLSAESDASLSRNAQWRCPCPIIPSPGSGLPGAPLQRTYVNCVIRNPAGETLGYAEMSCVVISLAPPPQQQSAPSSAPNQSIPTASYAAPPAAAVAAAALPAPLPPPSSATSPDLSNLGLKGEQGKPYIVRVVVGENDRRRRGGRLDKKDGEDDSVGSREVVAPARDGGRHRSPLHRLSANTTSKESLLYVLQYDVAYQLQSLSETTAAVLLREHPVLTNTPLSSSSKDGSVNVPKLTESIDQSVARMVKLANIVLQVANQLIDGSPAPPRAGTSREIKDMARQKRNPVNKLPVSVDGSVGHYLQYDVLYQLQCLSTNLAYVTLAYRDVLETPLSAIPKQHVEFCLDLGEEVQHLTKLLNILIQSSVDGTLELAASTSIAAKAKDEKKKSKSAHHNATTAQAKPSTRALNMSEVKTARSSSFSTSNSSSSSSSSMSSFDSSLNRPMTPKSAPTAPAAVPVAIPSPNPVVRSTPSQHLQPAPPTLVAPMPTSNGTPSGFVPLQPQISPPPHAAVANTQPTVTPTTPPVTESPRRDSSGSFLSVAGASPFSWVTAMNQQQRNTSLSASVTPQTSDGYGATAGIGFTTQPVVPTVAPPTLSASPRLSLPSLLTPPATHAAPTPISTVPSAIPIPVPIPR